MPPPPFQKRSPRGSRDAAPSRLPIRIVLVETSHPGNIGAAARSMKTMGLSDLQLVRPVDFPSEEAERRAVGAVDLLHDAVVHDDLSTAIADCRFVIGGSARSRELPMPVLDVREAGRRIVREARQGEPVAVLFGAERSGLTNQALDTCSHRLLIPTMSDFKSLNLAAAVQIVCYEILMARSDDGSQPQDEPSEPAASPPEPLPSHAEMEFFFDQLDRTLEARDFSGAVNPAKINAKLRRFITRGRPTENELKLLHGLVRLLQEEPQR